MQTNQLLHRFFLPNSYLLENKNIITMYVVLKLDSLKLLTHKILGLLL